MSWQLPVKLPLAPFETATSYIARLAAVNDCEVPEFCRDLGFELQDVVKGRDGALRRIAEATGASLDQLARHSLRKRDDTFFLNDEVLARPYLRRARTFVCPDCMRADMANGSGPRHLRPYSRDRWNLDPIRSCHEHKALLVEMYPEADGTLGYDFPTAVVMADPEPWTMPSVPAPLGVSPYEAYLLARIDSGCMRASWLDAFPWYAAARLCEMLGAISLDGARVRVEDYSFEQWYLAGAEGYRIATEGSAGITGLLGQLKESFFRAKADWGLRSTYGRLYEWLAYEDEDPVFDPLREILREYAISTMPFGAGDIIFDKPVEQRRVHSVRSAHLETKLHPKRLRKLLLQAGIISKQDLALPDDRILFDADMAERAIAEINGSMKLTEVGRYLNIPRAQLDVLLEAGHLKPFVVAGTGSIGSHAFAKRDVDQFRGKLFQGAAEVSTPGDRWYNIPSAAKRANCSAAEVVTLILNDQLSSKGIDPASAGYMAILVDLEEVKPLVRREDHGGVKLRDVEIQLRVSTRVLAALIDEGHLPASTVINPINRCPQRVVMERDLSSFQRTYVSLMEIAADRGVYAATLKDELAAQGISPAFDPAATRARFYRRAELGYLTPDTKAP